ncbi:MAG: MlaD family protein [Planctomycetota bacterium]
MHRSRNNVLAGLLVIVTVIATVFAVVMLGGAMDALGKRVYVVTFDLATGVEGLKGGADVRVGGIKVGTVAGVRLVDEGVEVDIRIDNTIALREGATPELQLALLGGQGVINFPYLGDGPQLAAGSVIEGGLAPPGFLAQAGYGEDQAEQLRNIMSNVDQFTTDIANTGPDVRAFITDLSDQWQRWKPQLDSITANVAKTVERGPAVAQSVEDRLAQAERMMETGQGYLDDNRSDVRTTIENFASSSEKVETFLDRLNGELSDLAAGFLEDGRTALTDARNAIVDIDKLFSEQKPNIRKSMGNFRLASDQLRDTLLEVRQAPWRLLYRPDTRELNFELLYDAARSYAGAVSDLRAATESLEAYSANVTDPTMARTADVELLVEQINSAFGRYQEAEQVFLDVLMEQTGDE